ncbi:hypothetical protein [Streptomyces albireticuli]|uniref:hypothetical protein n=1 Tax=Streptomyces albireticuli TaxID=1940 RepID=UPI0036BCAF42
MNRFLDHTGGVLTLVSLTTATVAWGLIATDRPLLTPRARLLAQAVHRAAAGALGHIGVKVAEAHAPPGTLPPFRDGPRGQAGLIGPGALAACPTALAGTAGAPGATRPADTAPGARTARHGLPRTRPRPPRPAAPARPAHGATGRAR